MVIDHIWFKSFHFEASSGLYGCRPYLIEGILWSPWLSIIPDYIISFRGILRFLWLSILSRFNHFISRYCSVSMDINHIWFESFHLKASFKWMVIDHNLFWIISCGGILRSLWYSIISDFNRSISRHPSVCEVIDHKWFKSIHLEVSLEPLWLSKNLIYIMSSQGILRSLWIS